MADGKKFCITGKLSQNRADFVALIEAAGGVVVSAMSKQVNYLISSRDDTAKAIKAIEQGTEVITEDDVLEMLDGTVVGGGAAGGKAKAQAKAKAKAKAPTKKKRKAPSDDEDDEDEADGDEDDGDNDLDGKCCCITGKLSIPREDVVEAIENCGGRVVSAFSGKVEILISSRDDTAKAAKAREQGTKVVDENWIMAAAGIQSAPAKKAKKAAPKKKKAVVVAESEDEDEDDEDMGAGSDALADLKFCITGKLSMLRSEFVDLIAAAGGSVVTKMSKKVDVLISARDDTDKAEAARAQGTKVISEAKLLRIIAGTDSL